MPHTAAAWFPLNQTFIAVFKDLFNAKFILASNRLAWIDYCRGLCIILVCYRHCFGGLKESGLNITSYPILEILNTCFYSFRMPLFFIVSGLFVSRSLQKKGLGDYIWGRFGIVFYPLIIWGSLQISLQLLLKNYVNGRPVPFDYVNLIIYPRNPSNNQQFWYLNALFFVGVFYAFFKVVCKFTLWHQLVLSLLLFTVSGYMFYVGQDFYIFPDIFRFYIYFCIGDIISSFIFKEKTTEIILMPKWLISSAILCIAMQALYTVINLYHVHHDVNGSDDYINAKMSWLYLPVSLTGCAFMIQLTQILQKRSALKWLRVIGYHSLYIYLMHLMLIAAVRIVLVKFVHITYVPLIMLIAISLGVIIPIFVYNFLVRLGAWWLFSLKKPDAEINHYTSMRTV